MPFFDNPHESVVERRIREAMDRGEFDDLPGIGEPLPDAGRPYDELWDALPGLLRRPDESRLGHHLGAVAAALGLRLRQTGLRRSCSVIRNLRW